MEIKIAVIEDSDSEYFVLEKCLMQYSETSDYTFDISRFGCSENFLEHYKPVYDIVFMDIVLPGMNGMEAAAKFRQLDPKTVLIFVTNMPQYAIKGYEVDALDYVLKPINSNSFMMKLEKALHRLNKPREGHMLRLRTENGVRLIETSDVMFIDILSHDMTTHTTSEKISSYGVLTEVEKQLSKDGFIRCSACSLVNLKYVDGIYGEDIKLKNGTLIRMTRSRKKEFMAAMTKYIFGGKMS